MHTVCDLHVLPTQICQLESIYRIYYAYLFFSVQVFGSFLNQVAESRELSKVTPPQKKKYIGIVNTIYLQ